MSSKKKKIDVESSLGQSLQQPILGASLEMDIFSRLGELPLKEKDFLSSEGDKAKLDLSGKHSESTAYSTIAKKKSSSGRVEIRRLTAGRGGKTVTAVKVHLASQGEELHMQNLVHELKQFLSCGGAVKDGVIELQGDQRERVETFFGERGFKVVRCGG